LNNWFKGLATEFQSAPAPASAGIVIGGASANEIRIRDNSIAGVAQGIHVGLSHRGAPAGSAGDVAMSVFITGNSVQVDGSALVRSHEGIFVGNCDNLVIEANRLSIARQLQRRSAEIDGIRVYGWLSSLVMIRHNRISGFDKSGIVVHPVGAPPKLQIPPAAQLSTENLIDS
jgi:hypothetical protein